jgi:cytochrome c5
MPKFSRLAPLASLALACGHAAPPPRGDCPDVQQAGCPANALTYDTGIGDLLNERCASCHAAGGVEAARPLTDYGDAFGARTGIATQLLGCSMPPAGAPPLSNEERQLILDWLTCRAPR